jgi:hypothetical protein
MLRVHGTRDSLLAALAAHWGDQQQQIPSVLMDSVLTHQNEAANENLARPIAPAASWI